MIQLLLPWPDRALSPNARIDRRAKAGIVAAHRQTAYLLALPYRGQVGEPVDVSLIFQPPDKRRRDLDNLYSSCKAYQDGVFQALGMDDHLIGMVELRFGKPVPGGRVIFTVMTDRSGG